MVIPAIFKQPIKYNAGKAMIEANGLREGLRKYLVNELFVFGGKVLHTRFKCKRLAGTFAFRHNFLRQR